MRDCYYIVHQPLIKLTLTINREKAVETVAKSSSSLLPLSLISLMEEEEELLRKVSLWFMDKIVP